MTFDRRQFLERSAVTATGLAALVGSAGTAAANHVPRVSTRGHYNGDGSIESGYSKLDYYTEGSVPGVDEGCAGDLTVHVHGYDNDEQGAQENTDDAQYYLTTNGYGGSVVGFSWDSDAPDKWDPTDWGGFGTGQEIAQSNGYALAQFALDFKWACPNSDLRLTCHSLGAQVVLNALRILDGNSYWNDEGFDFASVHFLGAAQDNEAPTYEWPETHDAIANETVATFNYHSDDDSTLQNLYWPREFDRALGETGYEDNDPIPGNYVENDVTAEVGSNHSAYMSTIADDIVYHMQNASYYG